MQRSRDWLDQAKRDLEHARQSIGLGHFEWSCFAAQQAAEKSLKALHLYQGTVAWGHSVFELLDGLPEGERPTAEFPRVTLMLIHRAHPIGTTPVPTPSGRWTLLKRS